VLGPFTREYFGELDNGRFGQTVDGTGTGGLEAGGGCYVDDCRGSVALCGVDEMGFEVLA